MVYASLSDLQAEASHCQKTSYRTLRIVSAISSATYHSECDENSFRRSRRPDGGLRPGVHESRQVTFLVIPNGEPEELVDILIKRRLPLATSQLFCSNHQTRYESVTIVPSVSTIVCSGSSGFGSRPTVRNRSVLVSSSPAGLGLLMA